MRFKRYDDGDFAVLFDCEKRRRQMNRSEWEVYAYIIEHGHKDKAIIWKHEHTPEYNVYEEDSMWEMAIVGKDGGYDGYTVKTFVPMHMSEAEWETFRNYFWRGWYNPYDDGRDCTGVKFTVWMDRYEVPNGTWVYHRIGIDV